MVESLSIVIPSHRHTDLLISCLKSVTRFAPPGTEMIVVDDGSPNASVSKTAMTFGGVTVVRFPKPVGFCAAANAGVTRASGTIVELLNDDATVTENWTVASLAAFADSRVAAVAPLILQTGTDPVRIDSAGDHYDRGGFAFKRHHGERPTNALRPISVNSVSACAAFYRRSALMEAGGFPADFHGYFDDADLACRLVRCGYHLRFEPDARVWHAGGASYGPLTRRLLEQQSRNEERLYWRNAAGWSTLPRHAAVLVGKALRRMEEGRLGPWLAGRLQAWALATRQSFTARLSRCMSSS